MRPLTFAILVSAVLVSGCASHPVDCSKGAGQNGCLPGTQEYEQMKMEREDAQTTAEIDDARGRERIERAARVGHRNREN